MSSAANDKRGKLEDEFRNRMYDAEASPSQQLWSRIDHSLTVQENGEYKKRAVFYRQLAAACIALLLVAGGVGAYYFGSAPASRQPLATVSPAPSASTTPTEQSTATNQAGATKQAKPTIAGTKANQTRQQATIPDTITAPQGASVGNQPVGPAAIAVVPAAALRDKISTNAASKDIEITTSEASGSKPAAENSLALTTPQAASPATGAAETRLSLYKPIRNTMAALGATGEKPAFNTMAPRSSLAAPATTESITDNFVKQNKQVMARAKQQEEARKALAVAGNEAVAAGSKKSAKESSAERSRWSLGMAYAPSYFDQNIGIPNQMMGASSRQSFMPGGPSATALSSLYMDQAREEYDENTDPGFSYGVEVKTSFRLGKKIKLLTGLGFLQNTSRSKSSYVIQQFWGNAYADAYDSNGPTSIFLPSISTNFATDSLAVAKTPEYKVNHRYRYLTVPVGLQYEGNMGKDWFWYGGAGVAANILLQTTILTSASEVTDVEYDVNENSPFRKLQWSGNVSAGVGKRLANHLSVTLGPEVRSYFTTLLAEPENTQAPQGKPYTIGVNMAVNYELGAGKKAR
ncbi:hypothetical protein GCM10023188_23880 [Pontibacter saemangeumensis]|uniref:Outer membrane protein beta-barrel domain-containing protein n=1 Tax=Pontibacter saemangeumensis TaxID=1084525 RepID=A0ABP8LRK4_9BACT